MANRNPSAVSNEQSLLNTIKLFFPDLEIELKDLKNPTPQFVLNFYAALLSELEVNINNLSQIQLNQMTIISHVDMYNQTIPHLNIYKAINYFAKNIGINDFSFSDMMNPNPRRTLVHLNAMMNFLEYCDNAVHDLSPEIEAIQNQRKKMNEIDSKIETHKREINLKATNRVKRAEYIKELIKTREKEKIILDERFKEKEAQKPPMENAKKMNAQNDEKEMQYARTIQDLEEEIEKYKGMIVKSPDKLKNELKHLEEKQQECIESIKSAKAQIEEKKKLGNRFLTERNEQEGRLEKLHEILELEKSIEEKKIRLDAIKKEHIQFTESIEEIKLNITSLSQKLKALKSNFEELKIRKNKQDAEMKEPLAFAEKEYKALIAEKEERMERDKKFRKKLDEISEQKLQLENDLKNFDEFFKNEYDALCKKNDEIRERFDKILEAAKARNQRLLEEDGDL